MTDLIQIKIKRSDYPRLVAHGVAGQAVHEAMTNLLDMAERPANYIDKTVITRDGKEVIVRQLSEGKP
jgi:hypothetical protein